MAFPQNHRQKSPTGKHDPWCYENKVNLPFQRSNGSFSSDYVKTEQGPPSRLPATRLPAGLSTKKTGGDFQRPVPGRKSGRAPEIDRVWQTFRPKLENSSGTPETGQGANQHGGGGEKKKSTGNDSKVGPLVQVKTFFQAGWKSEGGMSDGEDRWERGVWVAPGLDGKKNGRTMERLLGSEEITKGDEEKTRDGLPLVVEEHIGASTGKRKERLGKFWKLPQNLGLPQKRTTKKKKET